MTTTTSTTKAAFQTWNNGGLQMSSLYLNDDAVDFEERHFGSGTFATLHAFDSVEEGVAAFKAMQEELV